jgi:K+-transporting ATPase ATPase A chain
MNGLGIAQILAYLVVLTALAVPLGRYMAWVFERQSRGRSRFERGFLRLVGSDGASQDWKQYAGSLLVLGVVSFLALFLLLRLQGRLPFNPQAFTGVGPVLAGHTAASFVSSTNWQFFAGESTMSDLSQMAGLAVQNFIAPAAGLAALAAVIRGFSRRSASGLGNFWVDFYRSLVYVLAPLAVIVTAILIASGVPQTFDGYATAHTLEGATQEIARGPVASQVAIRTLGTNGGGFFNSNGATPFENPTGFTNFVLLVAQLLIPAASVFMFGRMIGSRRQSWVIYCVMFAMVVIGIGVAVTAEQHGSQVLRQSGVDLTAGDGSSGGNLADKEVRLGALTSAFFASVTTSSSGSGIDTGHDALTPAGGGVPLVNMFVGVVGGIGSGMWSMLLKILLAVFVAGLMIGRTPEFLGKKIEVREMKLVTLGLLFVPVLVLATTALSIGTEVGRASIFNSAAHGFTETLYAYTSEANSNGSAFAGFGLTNFAAFLGTFAMLLGRYVPIVAVLALAGSLALKQVSPASRGTLRTDNAVFGVFLLLVIAIMSGLTIFPALALGPIVEGLS